MGRFVRWVQRVVRELRRRQVIRVAVVYATTGFVVLQFVPKNSRAVIPHTESLRVPSTLGMTGLYRDFFGTAATGHSQPIMHINNPIPQSKTSHADAYP